MVAGLLLAAGSSRRLGQPKQLLPFNGKTLLEASLDVLNSAPVARRLVTIGGAAAAVSRQVDLTGFEVVESAQHSKGCSSSIVSALGTLDDVDGFIMFLGDQPGVSQTAIESVLAAAQAGHPVVVCKYQDGIGHPFYFSQETFDRLADLSGDKAVWKVIESGEFDVCEVTVDTTVPLDVDTWEDYEALLASEKGR